MSGTASQAELALSNATLWDPGLSLAGRHFLYSTDAFPMTIERCSLATSAERHAQTKRESESSQMGWRVGVDIGGTFTDVALVEEETGGIAIAKVPTTPQDIAKGVIAGLQQGLVKYNIQPAAVSLLAHATTIVTNALLEKKGAKTAFVTTRGFRDVLELRRSSRALTLSRPSPSDPAGDFRPRISGAFCFQSQAISIRGAPTTASSSV